MDKYEISLWEDYPTIITTSTGESKRILKERKIAVIGSDTMCAQGVQARALEPNLVEEINGCNTFTFKMYYTYIDNETGERYENPFGKYLINERKVKVYWKDKWYDLVIKKCQEDTSKKSVTYTCKDLFINELSKQGYSLEFDTELQNNIGTVEELAETVLEGSTWQYDKDSSTNIIQRTEGPVYEVTTTTAFSAVKSTVNGDATLAVTIPSSKTILVFYDSVVDSLDGAENVMIQFLFAPEGYKTDVNDMLVTNGDCYYILANCVPNGQYLNITSTDGNNIIRFKIDLEAGISTNYRAKRLVRNQLTEYDPLLDRYVLVCKDKDDEGKKIYEIITTEYSNPLAVINLIANPTEFISTAGWIGNIEEFGLYPKFSTESSWSDYVTKSYLKVTSGQVYNTGIQSNISYFQPTDIEIKAGNIGGIQTGEKYIFRYKAKANPNSNEYITSGITVNVYDYDKTDYTKGTPIFTSVRDGVFSNWVEYTLTCTKGVSADDIKNYGLFLTVSGIYWIEDIQFFKYQVGLKSYDDTEPQRMNPNEISLQSYAQLVYKYYDSDNDAAAANELTYLYIGEKESNQYKPVYNNYQKIITINEKESNHFNILQSIAETAQAWVRFRIEHEENGAISIDEDGAPKKFVYFIEEIGEDTGLSFEYGIDLNTISRSIDSDQLATKIIVNPNSNEFAQNGFCSIARSNQNYTKENFILNLDYYTQQNIIDEVELSKDLYSTQDGYIGYYYYLHKWNKQYDSISDELITKNMDLTKQQAQQEVYQQYLLAARQQKEQLESDVINLAGVSQWSDAEAYARSHIDNEKVNSLVQTHGQVIEQINSYNSMLNEINGSIQSLKTHINDLKDTQSVLLEQILQIHQTFNNKYTDYIMEGTWQDESYIDADRYFLDGLSVAYTSSRPQLSYTINVLRLSSLEEYSSKIFNLGDICYMQDREFFGYLSDKITPYKEKILVSKISSFFDEANKDVLTIQNYKTRFDDLFQRITATTQSLSYAEGSFARAAGAINPDGTLSFAALQDSFDYNENLVLNSSNQDVIWDETGITVINKLNSADQTKIIAGGIFVTNDGGETWKNAVRGDGISTELLTAGRINTSEIYIYDGNSPSFRWDSYGLTAYSTNDDGSINFGKFVRHDKYGIYGYDSGSDFKPLTEEDIWNNCRYGLTWKGFFLKSGNENTTFEISTDSDLLITANGVKRVQIGRIDGDSSNYGLQLKDKSGNTVFTVDQNGANIAGWTMNNTSIYKKDGNNTVGLYSTPNDGYYIKAGSNFGVKSDGSIVAKAGTIGGWTITDSSIESISSINSNQWTKIFSSGELRGQISNKISWSISRNGFQFLDLSGSQTKDAQGNQIVLGNTKITNNTLYTSNINASGGSVGGVGLGKKGSNVSIVDGAIYGKSWHLGADGLTLGGTTLPTSNIYWDTITYVSKIKISNTTVSTGWKIPTAYDPNTNIPTSYLTVNNLVTSVSGTGATATVLRSKVGDANVTENT